MSRDDTKVEKVETVAKVDTLAEKAKTTAPAVDSAEQIRKACLARRAESTVHGSQGRVKALGHERFVPEGFRAEYINPAGDYHLQLQQRGWDFVRDDKGEVCYLVANKDRLANEHRFPYMMTPNEIADEEMREAAKASRNRLQRGMTDPTLPITDRMRNDPFFHDMGLSNDSD